MNLSRRVQFTEFAAARLADIVLTHSTREAELLSAAVPGARIHVVPWSVPAKPITATFAERGGIAFICGYDHAPNLDAARWLINDIMPLVWQRTPDIECLLVGSNMPDEMVRLSRAGIVPIGYTENLEDIFNRVRLTVAPLRFGAGLKGKLVESLAAGVPCVSTSIAAEGFALPTLLADYVVDEPQAFAQLICRLHEDRWLNDEWALLGLQHIAEHCSEERVCSLMKAALRPIL
jgi:glycosyltransferase involved in cell wall biosynthesis